MINNLYIKATPTVAAVTWGSITGTLSAQTDLQNALNAKQVTLVSGTNIKTVNSTSLLGAGDVSVGTVTSVGVTAGTGISVSGSPITSSGSITVTNSAPDQVVALTAGSGIGVAGTYPNFTVTNSAPSSGGTVTSVAALTVGTTGTDLTSTVATGTTTPVITLNVPTASAANRGALSSADWTTFNNKQASGNYITALTGEATATGPGSVNTTLSNSAVIGKVLTGLNLAGGGTIANTDSILLAFGKVQNQISGLLGGVTFQGVWNASTNTPTLTSSVGTKGYYYIVNVAGSTNLNGITDWKIGDWAVFNGTTWDKVDNTDAVSSVNGFTGTVSLTTADISEVTNLYYTEARVNANTNVAANTAARHNAVTIGTANGLSLSTQALSLNLASTSVTGALSSTDWTTFNNKQNALGFTAVPTTRTISTTAPLSGGGDLSADRTLSIPQATTLVNGYLSATDWNTFNGKQAALVSGTNIKTINSTTLLGSGNIAVEPTITAGTTGQYYRGDKSFQTLDKTAVGLANVDNTSDANKPISTATQTALNAKQGTITLTTTGTSGASTLVGNTLNIPQYIGGVTAVTGTAPVVSSGGTTPAISMPAATTSVDGYLTSTDWTTFNGKQAALVSGTNIKTVNGTSLLGAGDIVAGLPAWVETNATDLTIWNNGKGNIASNTSFGDGALKSNTTGSNNTAVGLNALSLNITGSNNSAFGPNALGANTSGGNNVAIGYNALSQITITNNSTAVGYASLSFNTTGTSNTAIGYNALTVNTTGINNTAVGSGVLDVNTTGSYNTVIGKDALGANTTGGQNTAIGYNALLKNTTASGNTAIGNGALGASTTAGDNTAIGNGALTSNTTGTLNTALGSAALVANTTGGNTTALGAGALTSNTTGIENTAVGSFSLQTITTGSQNTAIGYNTNSPLGFSGSTILGANAVATASNQFVVGSTTTNAGTVVAEINTSANVWNVRINGVARKILLA